MKNTQYRFRCIRNPQAIYTPEYMFDVEPMRKHPEYEEIDAEGNVIKGFAEREGVQTVPIITKQAEEQKPAKRGKRK